MTSEFSLFVSLIVLGAFTVLYLRDEISSDPEPDSPEAARQAYQRGEITLDELERRLDVALDEDAQRIREAVEPIPGVGPALSTAIAERFDDVDEVRAASIAELESVPGVGGAKADAIKERLK